MSDLISRQAAYDALMAEPLKFNDSSVWESARCYQWMMDMDVINDLPSAQPIIRCKDCTHYDAGFECLIEGYGIVRDQDWYCADAERRTDGSDRETGGD